MGKSLEAWQHRLRKYRRLVSTPLNLMNPKHSNTSICIRLIAAGTCLTFFAGCAQIAVVSEKRPAPLPPGSGANLIAAQTIDIGLAEEQKQPIVALGAFVAAARDSLRQLDRNPRTQKHGAITILPSHVFSPLFATRNWIRGLTRCESARMANLLSRGSAIRAPSGIWRSTI